MSFGEDLERQREHVMQLVRHASTSWAAAMRAHQLAPPDPGFASRLQALSEAAATEQIAWERAHAAGMRWRPVPGAESTEPPYELRPGTGRRGPGELWSRFDMAVASLNQAVAGSSAETLAGAFGEMSDVAAELAEAVKREDITMREALARSRSRGAA